MLLCLSLITGGEDAKTEGWLNREYSHVVCGCQTQLRKPSLLIKPKLHLLLKLLMMMLRSLKPRLKPRLLLMQNPPPSGRQKLKLHPLRLMACECLCTTCCRSSETKSSILRLHCSRRAMLLSTRPDSATSCAPWCGGSISGRCLHMRALKRSIRTSYS